MVAMRNPLPFIQAYAGRTTEAGRRSSTVADEVALTTRIEWRHWNGRRTFSKPPGLKARHGV